MLLALPIALLMNECARAPEHGMIPSGPRNLQGRGTIVTMPTDLEPRIAICHAAIPNLGPEGRPEPSDPALMPFWLKDNAVLPAGLHPGDAVQFDLTVDWNLDRPVLITALRKLEPGDSLSFDCR